MAGIRLSPWSRPGVSAIYLNGYPGAVEKVSIRLTGGSRISVSCGPEIEPDEVLATLEAQFGVAAQKSRADGRAYFAALEACAAASPPPPRARGRVPAPGTRYASPKAEGEDLAFENIENELQVLVEIDHREPEGIDAYLARTKNLEVRRTHLPIGDYRLNGRVVVERKSTRDFALSVGSHHIFDQAQRIGFEEGAIGFVIIEGDVFGEPLGMLDAAITGAISCLSLVQGMNVFQTKHLEHTAYVLAKLAQHERNGLGYKLSLRKDKPTALLDAQRFTLEGINGIHTELANELLRHFGSVRAVFAASADELKAVKGMGPKRIEKFLALVTGQYAPH